MFRSKHWQRGSTLAMLCLFVMTSASLVLAANVHAIANNTPRIPANAQNLGPENASKSMTVTVWLRQHNKA